MRAASLCSGIEGLGLACERVFGAEPVWFCESDPHCATVLNRHWPGVPVMPDVREIDAGFPAVELLHAGYPCQPFSQAGKRLGEEDPRHLWPAVRNAIRVLGPRVVVLENVSAHLRVGFFTVLGDLAALGFSARWGVIRAADVGAPHRRERLFVLAHAEGAEWQSAQRHSLEASVGRAPEPGERVGASAVGGETASDPRFGGCGERPELNGGASENTAKRGERSVVGEGSGEPERCGVSWGNYEPAIRRWEAILGRAAPAPTDERRRLMPSFVEWMMGFPEDWVDGLARTHALRMLGNSVSPPQGELALHLLSS